MVVDVIVEQGMPGIMRKGWIEKGEDERGVL
jgi:hypothetical protein